MASRKFAYWKRILEGTGSPEGVVKAPIGTLYIRTDGGASTMLYLKVTGAASTNTGWKVATFA